MAIGLVFILAVFAVRYLGYIWTWAALTTQIRRTLSRRTDVKYTLLLTQLLEMEVPRCRTFEEFDSLFRQMLVRAGFCLNTTENTTGFLAIELDNHSGHRFMLYAPLDQHDKHYWYRMADCFRNAHAKAGQRWPAPLAAHTSDAA